MFLVYTEKNHFYFTFIKSYFPATYSEVIALDITAIITIGSPSLSSTCSANMTTPFSGFTICFCLIHIELQPMTIKGIKLMWLKCKVEHQEI